MQDKVPDLVSRPRGVLSRREAGAGFALAAVLPTSGTFSQPAQAQAPSAPVLDLTAATALVMVEDRGCPYCARFDAETRDAYVNSPEGRLAPLVRRRRGDASIAFLERVVYSPTFVLLVGGREIGRAVGYQGSELFWMEIAGLMRKAQLPGAG